MFPENDKKLKGFIWRENEKPKNKSKRATNTNLKRKGTKLSKKKINDYLGCLLVRTIASKNESKINFPDKNDLSENMVLDLEYSVLIPVKVK